MRKNNIYIYPLESGTMKRRLIFSGVALGLMLVLTLVGHIGVKQGWLEMKPTRHGGIQYSLVRETEPVTDSVDLTVRFYVMTEEAVAKKCPACGETVSLEAVSCPHCGNAEGEFTLLMKCPDCGNLYDADDPQCPFCGER